MINGGRGMRKSILLVWTSFLSSCAPFFWEPSCGPDSVEGKTWASALKEDTPTAYREYLARYPYGCFATEAMKKLKSPVVAPKVKKVVGGGPIAGGAY